MDELANHFKQVRNLGRVETPHAWAFDNAELLAGSLPVLMHLISNYEKALLRITSIRDADWMAEIARNALSDVNNDLIDRLKEKI